MSEDWSEKWYKQAFARSSAGKPKAEVWSGIESALNGWFKHWYQSGATGQTKRPKAQVWNALSAFVDQEILLRRQLRLRILRGATAIVLFAILPLSLADQFELSSQNESTTRFTAENIAPISASEELASVIHTTIDREFVAPQMQDTRPQIGIAEMQHASAPQETISLASASDNAGFESVNVLEPHALASFSESNPVTLTSQSFDFVPRPFNLPKWIFGASAVYQHSHLYNETTRMGFAHTSHIKNDSDPSFSLDLALMKPLSKHSLISVRLRINDVKGQGHYDLLGAEYVEKKLTCTYQSLSLNYHRSLLRSTIASRASLEISAGFYGSYRTNIQESIDQEDRVFLSPGIRKYDFGLQCGLQSVFRVSKPLHITLGAYYTNGIMNIFKGVEKVPANFYTSFTASYGLSLGLRYQLNL